MPIYKKINKNFFKKWSSDMAYIIGFFSADGSMGVNRRGSEYFSFQIKDRVLIQFIKKSLNSDHKISFSKKTKMYRLQIGSKEMCRDLKSLGFCQSKTKSMSIPNVPDRFFLDFVRGYFDGDGHVWIGMGNKRRKRPTRVIQTVFTSCSKGFLTGIKERLEAFGLKGRITCGYTYFRLCYSIHSSLKLFSLMYKDISNKMFLERKKKKFDKYIRMRE